MSRPRFSVVIPTRERAETLRHSLRSCLDQNFDEYEIIVSDNFSSPKTYSVVAEAASPRVHYVRTPGPLAMSMNWEFGVSRARGEYVIVIGDDDGLMPYALRELDGLFRESGARAIRWDAAYYTWPSFAIPGQGNFLRVPVGRGVREIDALPTIRAVIEFREFYTNLPMLYNAAVHRDVLEEMRNKADRVFAHSIPDVYSGFAVAAVARRYLSTDVPMSVSGQSGASNGIATLCRRGQSEIDKEFRDLNSRERALPGHHVPNLPAFPHVPVADSFLHAKKLFFPDSDMTLDRRQFVTGCVENLRVADEPHWQESLAILREWLSDDPALQAWFDECLGKTPYRELPLQVRPEILGLDGEYLLLDAAAMGVANVAGAAWLCENILNYRTKGVRYLKGELGNLKVVSSSTLALIDSLQEQLRLAKEQLERGGRLRQAQRWVKSKITAVKEMGQAVLLAPINQLTRFRASR
jgi:hypothetical protein